LDILNTLIILYVLDDVSMEIDQFVNLPSISAVSAIVFYYQLMLQMAFTGYSYRHAIVPV